MSASSSALTKTYATGTLVAAALMLVALLWPAGRDSGQAAAWAVGALAAVPVLGALITAARAWPSDRKLSYAALLALLGLGLVGAGLRSGWLG